MSKDFDFLDSERRKLWDRLTKLEDIVAKRTPELESEARQNSKKCSEFRNKCEQSKEEALSYLAEIRNSHAQFSTIAEQISALNNQVINNSESTRESNLQIQSIQTDIESRKIDIEAKITSLEELFDEHDSFVERISSLESIHKEAQDYLSKMKVSYTQLQSRSNEVDELYYNIIGYDEIDEDTAQTIHKSGLKDGLETAYTELETSFEKFQIEKKREVTDAIEGWKQEYQSHSKKIQSLLPNALTTGLSYAYTKKKDDEIEESRQLQKRFQFSIWGLIGVSLIPFLVSINFLLNKVALSEVILQMPRLVLAILPLYIPVLWMAYSANRKLNLSKRLIEEYTHKEVLSKTFEGLAKQIEDLSDSEVSEELRARLLYNILEVSSENPGKLISNYDKSDHPLMDALDKSVQLTNAVDKLAKIPGLRKLTTYLEAKADRLIEEEGTKADAGLDTISK